MSLARVKTWIPGDVLTASDLNAEFNNLINNPVSLISPSTAGINFNLQAHTNLIPSAITASSATAGQALVASGGATVWGAPSVASATITGFSSGDTPVGTSSGALSAVSIGSTGKVYAVTSSNSAPAWQVLPIDGGLSTFTPTIGMVYSISSSAGFLKGIAIGTSGQVFMVTTSGMPGWQNLTTGGSAGGGSASFSSQFIIQEDWAVITSGDTVTLSTSITTNGSGLTNYAVTSSGNSGVALTQLVAPSGLVRFTVNALSGSFALAQGSTIGAIFTPFQSSLNPQLTMMCYTSVSTGVRMGLSTAGALGSDPTNGMYFRTSGLGSTWTAVTRVGGLEFTVATTAVSSTTPQTFQIIVSASGTTATVKTNGVTAGTFSSSQIPSGTNFTYGVGSSLACNMVMDAWQLIQDRSSAST